MKTTFGLMAALLLAQPAGVARGAQPAGAARSVKPVEPARPPRMVTLTPAGPALTLEAALHEAGARNLDLQAARARLDQSRELQWKAWAACLPQISASGTFTHNNTPDITFPFPAFSTVRARTGPAGSVASEPADPALNPVTGQALPGVPSDQFLFSQNIDVLIQRQNQLAARVQATLALFAPEAWYGIAAARAGERAAEQGHEATRRDILFGVAQSYYSAASLLQVVSVQERQLIIALDHERDARVRYEAGTTPKVTLLRAEIDRARAEQDLKRAQNGYLSAKVGLAALLDRPAADFEVAVPSSPQVPPLDDAALEQAAERDRPDVKAAGEQVVAAHRTRMAVIARYLPALGAFGHVDWSNATGFTGDRTTWAVGLQLAWNLFDGLARESDLRLDGARVREAEATREGTLVRARADVRQARLDLESAVANREKAKEQLSLARENQRLVNVNYRAGAATYIEVSDANTALLTAELSVVSEGLAADLASLRLLKAAGAFNPAG